MVLHKLESQSELVQAYLGVTGETAARALPSLRIFFSNLRARPCEECMAI
jgi:hypothetical protein